MADLFPGMKRKPRYRSEFLRFLQPVLDALRDKGGQARSREVYDVIAEQFKVTDEQREVRTTSGVSRFENQIAFARAYLFKTGYLDAPEHGIWRLTEKGWAARLDGPEVDAIFRRVQELRVSG